MTKKTVAFFLTVLTLSLSNPLLGQVQQTAPTNPALSQKLIHLYSDDQTLLADMDKALQDAALRKTYATFVKRALATGTNSNFYFPQVYELWAQAPDAPAIVHRYVDFRRGADKQMEDIVQAGGWPRRAAVGDEAAADFLFLFGHADDDNAWRLQQVPAMERVSQQDHWNPRCYAHLRDRVAVVAGQPQIYGTVMGPDYRPDAPKNSARLYSPLVDSTEAANHRRVEIGLPTIEVDLDAFRHGASIGVFMIPMKPGMTWKTSDVFATPTAP